MDEDDRKAWEELDRLVKEWQDTFGDTLGYGFDITPDQIPLIKQCLREHDQAPLKRHIDAQLERRILY